MIDLAAIWYRIHRDDSPYLRYATA